MCTPATLPTPGSAAWPPDRYVMKVGSVLLVARLIIGALAAYDRS